MLIYEKKVEDERHIFGTLTGTVPSEDDSQLEYIAVGDAAKEVVWNREFLNEFGVVPSAPSSSPKSIHVMRKYHFIRRIVADGNIMMCKVHTDDNITDPLTKSMSRPIGEWL